MIHSLYYRIYKDRNCNQNLATMDLQQQSNSQTQMHWIKYVFHYLCFVQLKPYSSLAKLKGKAEKINLGKYNFKRKSDIIKLIAFFFRFARDE